MSCDDQLDQPSPFSPSIPVKLVVAVALIDADGRVLLAQRPDDKSLAGLWEFPGGKIEKDEVPEYALMRELREELGIETRPGCFLPVTFASHSYDSFHLLMPLYACRNWRGIPKALEHQALAWVDKTKLQDYEMPAADYPLIHSLRMII